MVKIKLQEEEEDLSKKIRDLVISAQEEKNKDK
jgi:hypothetical protein